MTFHNILQFAATSKKFTTSYNSGQQGKKKHKSIVFDAGMTTLKVILAADSLFIPFVNNMRDY